MSYTKDLELSPKFADFLAEEKSLLRPLVNALKEYREMQNYPFLLKDKRLFRADILKALCNKPELTIKEIEITTDKWIDDMYESDSDDKISDEMQELFKKYKVPKELEKNVVFMNKTLDAKSFNEWIKKAVKGFGEVKAAESDDDKAVEKVTESKMNKALSDKLNEIAAEENGESQKNNKKSKPTTKKLKTK